jgi:hypothetical protein
MSLLVGMDLPDVIKIDMSNQAECSPNGFRSVLGLVEELLRMQVVQLPKNKSAVSAAFPMSPAAPVKTSALTRSW